jgi:hypothetical protein
MTQSIVDVASLGAVAIPDDIYTHVGTAAKYLDDHLPTTGVITTLVARKGDWVFRIGDFESSGMPSVVDPAASVTDGSGTIKLTEGSSIILPGIVGVTVKGFNSTDALDYFYR